MNNSKFSVSKIIPINVTKFRQPDPVDVESKDRFSTKITPSGQSMTFLVEPLSDRSDSILRFPQPPAQTIESPKALDRFLPSSSRWLAVGGMVMMAVLGGAIALSTFLKYKVTIQAPATIRPVGELRLVQSTIEGSVLSLSVGENQAVRKGDWIATVKDLRLESKLQTRLHQLAGDSQKARQQLSAIDAQIRASDRQNVAEIDRGNRSIAGIQSELNRADRDYHDKQITTQAEVVEAQANWQAARREQLAAQLELKVVEANLRSTQASYQSAFARSQRYQDAGSAGAISTNLLEESQLATQQQAEAISAQKATILKQQQIVARLAAIVTAAAARLQRTQTAVNPSRAESTTIVQKIAGEQANGKAAIARLQQEQLKLLQQRVEIANQIATNDREIAQISIELKPVPILAPVSGTIQELSLRNNAQVVHPGDRIAQIIPTGTPLNIKAFVAISDISNVKVGQTVQMRVSACPYTDYGVASGKVHEISADAKSTEKNTPQQPQTAVNGVYEVTIKPSTLILSRGGNKCEIRSGMDGRADIISKQETVWQFMLKKARLLSIDS
jgi:multidrug efflux pump subunit AcrA (membrane-fusion protein)